MGSPCGEAHREVVPAHVVEGEHHGPVGGLLARVGRRLGARGDGRVGLGLGLGLGFGLGFGFGSGLGLGLGCLQQLLLSFSHCVDNIVR